MDYGKIATRGTVIVAGATIVAYVFVPDVQNLINHTVEAIALKLDPHKTVINKTTEILKLPQTIIALATISSFIAGILGGRATVKQRKKNDYSDMLRVKLLTIRQNGGIHIGGHHRFEISKLFEEDPAAGKYIIKQGKKTGLDNRVIQLNDLQLTEHIIAMLMSKVKILYEDAGAVARANANKEEVKSILFTAKIIQHPKNTKKDILIKELVSCPREYLEFTKTWCEANHTQYKMNSAHEMITALSHGNDETLII